MDQTRLSELAQKLLEGTVTPAEYEELALAMKADENGDLAARLTVLLNGTTENEFNDAKWQALADRILDMDRMMPAKKQASVISMIKKMVAAASIILVLGTGAYFLFFNQRARPGRATETAANDDVKAPSALTAVLTLADGQKIILDSVANGVVSVQGNRNVVMNNGQVDYTTGKNDNGGEVLYNTLSVPRGSKIISVVLADGSRVWLNSESSLRYPTAFTGPARRVELVGEGYFEVSKNAAMPFIVAAAETNIKVLGTSFNVNAYAQEPQARVTLLEGSVDVSKNGASKMLKPGQQAEIKEDIEVHASVNTEEVMAWKNGRFAFNGSGIQQVMRELARWYDLDVVYQQNVKEKFHVEMTRNTNLSNVFRILEGTGGVHFKIEGKKIIVMP